MATPVLTLYFPLSLAIVMPLMLVLATVSNRLSGRSIVRVYPVSSLVIAGLIATAIASCLWSYSPELTLDKLPKTSATLIAGIFLLGALSLFGDAERRGIFAWLIGGVAAAFFLIVIEYVAGGVLVPFQDRTADPTQFYNQFNRGLSVLSIFIWPAVLVIARKRLVWGVAAVLVVLSVFLAFRTSSANAAIILGALSFLIVYMAPRTGTIAIAAILAVSVMLAPAIERELPAPKELLETLKIPRSSYHRLIIWKFTTENILERPILGWGFNLARGIPGGKVLIDTTEDALPLHPHNAALQWRLELGILGALFGAGLFVAAAEAVRRHAAGRLERAIAMATVTAAFTIAMLSFGIWQTWWISALFLAAGFSVLVCGRTGTSVGD